MSVRNIIVKVRGVSVGVYQENAWIWGKKIHVSHFVACSWFFGLKQHCKHAWASVFIELSPLQPVPKTEGHVKWKRFAIIEEIKTTLAGNAQSRTKKCEYWNYIWKYEYIKKLKIPTFQNFHYPILLSLVSYLPYVFIDWVFYNGVSLNHNLSCKISKLVEEVNRARTQEKYKKLPETLIKQWVSIIYRLLLFYYLRSDVLINNVFSMLFYLGILTNTCLSGNLCNWLNI